MRHAATLVYDGDCAFCTRCVAWAQRHLEYQPEILPFQTADLHRLGIRRADAERSVQWVAPDGAVSSGARAIGQWWWRSGGGWRLPGALCLVPPTSWVAEAVYRVVARHRHQLPGGSDSCAVEKG